ncbi:type II toxin-antitoxin system VapC family toxin [Novosphingopyxis sp.]|uniref:type II toxin-antitoxin system VapC family toxin n=1 Tax=Novosphingopyxis sp. TaxID=2709690 RepID=UPI003B59FE2C
MRILADSSVWIDHFRSANERFSNRLGASQILCHPFVIGELALGSLASRETKLAAMSRLRMLTKSSDEEVMAMVERRRLWNRGIGLVDAHLLASVLISQNTELWTFDRRLEVVAREANVSFEPIH